MNRETVIKALEYCAVGTKDCAGCPMKDDCKGVSNGAMAAAARLLKEQEPIQMKVSEDYGSIKFGYCPKCKSFINNRSYPKSCGCGQKVKWDD